MSAALQLVKPAPHQPSLKVLNDSAIAHLASLNTATRQLRQWGISVDKINPYDSRHDSPVITIRRDPDVSLRALLDKAITRSWHERTCYAEFCGCIVTWSES